jgi:thiol-disulfide isomerase/thioredoxin
MNPATRSSAAVSRAAREAQAKRRNLVLYGSLGLVAVVLVVAVALMSRVPKTASDAPVVAQLTVGQKAPEFAVSTTDGPFDLAHNGGKPTLLEVFATWCPHCQHEVSILNPLYAKLKGAANVVAVSGSAQAIDEQSPESQADVVAFTQRFGTTYPVAFDPDLAVAKGYLQGGFPTIVLISKDDKVLAIGSGELPAAGLEKAVSGAIIGKPVSPTFDTK